MSEIAASYQTHEEADWVCGHCKGPVVAHLFHRGDHWLRSYHCPLCGDVIPVRAGPPRTRLARLTEAARAE